MTETTTAPRNGAYAVSGEDLVDRIDRVTGPDQGAATPQEDTAAPVSYDAGVDDIEAALRQILNPKYTFFQKATAAIPESIQTILTAIGSKNEYLTNTTIVQWATSDGLWTLMATPGAEGGVNATISGPSSSWQRKGVQMADITDTLRLFEAIP